MKSSEAVDLVPFEYLGERYAVTSWGEIVFGLELEMREVFTMEAGSDRSEAIRTGKELEVREADDYYHVYKNAILSLPEETRIQKINQFYVLPHKRQEGEGRTMQWNEEMYLQREIVFQKTYLFLTIPLSDGSRKAKRTILGSLVDRVGKFDGLLNEGLYLNHFETFKSAMNGTTISKIPVCSKISELSGNDILSVFCSIWNGRPEERDGLQDVLNRGERLMFGEKYRVVLTSRTLPESFNAFSTKNNAVIPSKELGVNRTDFRGDGSLAASYLFPVGMGIPLDHTVVETLVIENRERVESKLKSYVTWMKLASTFYPDVRKKSESMDPFMRDKTEFGFHYGSFGLTVLVDHHDYDVLIKIVNKIRAVADNRMGMKLSVENKGAWNGFYSSLPGCSIQNKNLRLGYVEVLSYMTHIESFKRGNSSGIVFSDIFGRPFLYDFWDENNVYLNARNGMILGPTGGGKSFTTNHILDQSYHHGDFICIIDVGGSYRRITKLVGGKYIDSEQREFLQFNPFMDCYYFKGKYYPELDANGKRDPQFLNKLTTLVIACWYGASGEDVSKEVVASITVTLNGYFDHLNRVVEKEDPCFHGYYHYVLRTYGTKEGNYQKFLDIDSFQLILQRFTREGEYGELLNAEKSLGFSERWIAFDLKKVADDSNIIAPVLMMIMHMIEQMMERNFGNRFRIFLEEAIDFLGKGFFADYVSGLYRKIRKMGGQIMLVTQSIEFLDEVDPLVKSSILSNSQIKIITNHGVNEKLFAKMQKELSFSDSEIELLRNQTEIPGSGYKIPFIKFGSMPGFLIRLEVSKKTYSVYQTEAKEIKKIDALINRMGIEAAVETYVEESNKEEE